MKNEYEHYFVATKAQVKSTKQNPLTFIQVIYITPLQVH